MGDNVRIFPQAKIIGEEMIEFGSNIIIDDFVFIYARRPSRIGSYVHIGCGASIAGGETFVMEDFSGLSHGCRLFTGTEDCTGDGFGNPTIPERFRNVKRAPVHIGKFAVIGSTKTAKVPTPVEANREGTVDSIGLDRRCCHH